MDRVEFTDMLVTLLMTMFEKGENPLLDYVKRSQVAQEEMVAKGLSRTLNSRHLYGKAADIYFVEDGKLSDPRLGWEYWHEVWEGLGGKPMLSWDKGHFE